MEKLRVFLLGFNDIGRKLLLGFRWITPNWSRQGRLKIISFMQIFRNKLTPTTKSSII